MWEVIPSAFTGFVATSFTNQEKEINSWIEGMADRLFHHHSFTFS